MTQRQRSRDLFLRDSPPRDEKSRGAFLGLLACLPVVRFADSHGSPLPSGGSHRELDSDDGNERDDDAGAEQDQFELCC